MLTYRSLSCLFVSVYLMLSGSEWLVLASRPSLKPYFSQNAVGLRLEEHRWPSRLASFAAFILVRCDIRSIPLLLILSGVCLFAVSISSATCLAALLTPLFLLLLFHSTVAFGLDAADQMVTFVLIANVAAAASPVLAHPFNCFVAFQLLIAYGVAGVAKATSPAWRSGEAILSILSTRSLGIELPAWLRARHSVARAICISIILFEISWLLAPLNLPLLLVLMALGSAFHLIIAWTMGLNLFLWAFLAAYPLAYEAVLSLHTRR